MKESVFTTHVIDITLKGLKDRLTIRPFGDVHRDTPNCDLDRWKEWLKCVKKNHNENTWYLSSGDLLDFMSWSERKKIRNASLHESTISRLDAAALNDCTSMLDDLWFAKDKFIGFVQGNHTWEFTDGDLAGKSADQYFAERMNSRWLGDLAYIRLRIGFKNTSKKAKIDIVCCHGKAGGKLAGSTVNQLDDLRVIFPNADMYVMGHDHRKVAVPVTSLHATHATKNGLRIKEKRQWLIRSGSFLRGYVPNQAGYIVKALLRPTDLGVPEIKCGFKRDCSGGTDVITNDIKVEY